jgi:hypothetical protein
MLNLYAVLRCRRMEWHRRKVGVRAARETFVDSVTKVAKAGSKLEDIHQLG